MVTFLALAPVALTNGAILGWSVAWPPGPVNAEMIRRGLLPRTSGGGFWAAWQLGLGACSGDFCWALCVSAGAGALVNTPQIRLILGLTSIGLLLGLALIYAVSAWRAVGAPVVTEQVLSPNERKKKHGYFLGLTMALASPFNVGFWFAVIGGQQSAQVYHSLGDSLALACSVVAGAITWTIVLCSTIKLGARIFAKPAWQISTQALTAAIMIFFAARLCLRLF